MHKIAIEKRHIHMIPIQMGLKIFSIFLSLEKIVVAMRQTINN